MEIPDLQLPPEIKQEQNIEMWQPYEDDPSYYPSDEFSIPSSEDEEAAWLPASYSYVKTEHAFVKCELPHASILRKQNVNTRIKKEKSKLKRRKVKKSMKMSPDTAERRRYKRRDLSDYEKLQASLRRRTCLVKKPKSQYLGVSWCNTKNTWVARVWHPTERKLIWAGYHADERLCAIAVNEKCVDLQIPLKNPHVV